ncbi:hypothetical protein ACOSQ2_024307 [Xanthoceras sorbifolium]
MDGELIVALLRYECLLEFCFACGKIGHGLRDCSDEEARTEALEGSTTKFSSWMRAPLGDRSRVKMYKQEERGASGTRNDGVGLKSLEGPVLGTVTGGVFASMKKTVVGEEVEDFRSGPGLRVSGVSLDFLGERGMVESGGSVGPDVKAQWREVNRADGNLGKILEAIVESGVGAQVVVLGNLDTRESGIEVGMVGGSGLLERETMEGVELEESEAVGWVGSESGPSEVQLTKLIEPKEKSVRKWKRAAQAWSRTQILGKASSPLQRMLVASQKIIKSPRRKSMSPGQRSPVPKGTA